MTRLIFIHGTGVRKESFENSLSLITSRVEGIRNYEIVPCFWGDKLGATLGAEGYSVPGSDSTTSSSTPVRDDISIQSWAVLDVDPWSHIRAALAMSDGIERDSMEPVKLTSSFEEALAAATITQNSFTQELGETPLAAVAERALDSMISHPLFEEYTASSSIDAGNKIVALSGTYLSIALAEWETLHSLPLGMTGDHRQRLEALLIEELGGEVRSLGNGIVKVTSRLLWPLLAPSIEKHRHGLTQYGAPLAGDVLKYFARPGSFRQLLTDIIDESEDETVILAHSLGAIIAFDTLFLSPRPHVRHLITVGTQVGLLFELDALPSLGRGGSLPAEFPRWDNIFDPRDFLAYRSSAFFEGQTEDHAVDNRAPFPRCHESYFDNQQLYTVLDRILM